jgi:uncharacterized phage protein (TIGR02218 family)
MTDVLENAQLQEMYGEPELYIVATEYETYRYTSWRENITSMSQTFEPIPVKRSPIGYDSKLGEVKVTVSVPVTKEFVQKAVLYPIRKTTVQIAKITVSEPNERTYIFDGIVRNVTIEKGVAQAQCTGMDKLSTRGPKVIYQSNCNWQVFDSNCGLSQTPFKVNANIDSFSPEELRIHSTSFSAKPAGYFAQGKVYYLNDWRFITDHAEDYIRLHYRFSDDLVVDAGVDVYPGCDGTVSTCQNTFNNYSKFCGMPYIPSSNPVIWGFK